MIGELVKLLWQGYSNQETGLALSWPLCIALCPVACAHSKMLRLHGLVACSISYYRRVVACHMGHCLWLLTCKVFC
jgi:hypothetical protein